MAIPATLATAWRHRTRLTATRPSPPMSLCDPASSKTFRRPAAIRGTVTLPGDKSISHRALLLAALGDGPSELVGLGTGQDVAATARALQQLGLRLEVTGDRTVVHGRPLQHWTSPTAPIDCGNSGTTLRLLTGILAAAPGLHATLVGDESLSRRPMARVIEPLRAMGARIEATPAGTAPLRIQGQRLQGTVHRLQVASAQVKTALLLAGLHADGETVVTEPEPSRDHTERMLAALQAPLHSAGTTHRISRGKLRPLGRLQVPGDPSSAAFLLVLAALHPDGDVTVRSIALSPGRTGFLRYLQQMGARLDLRPGALQGGEPVGDVRVRSSALRGADLAPGDVPACIDELPILGLAAACATGTSSWQGIAELRVKESDRLAALEALLRSLGVPVRSTPSALQIDGLGKADRLRADPPAFDPGLDHRMAMTAAIAGLVGPGAVTVLRTDSMASSFPGFLATVARLGGSVDTDVH